MKTTPRSALSFRLAILLALIVWAATGSAAMASDWLTWTVDDENRAGSTSLVFDPNDQPAIGYFDIDECRGGSCSGGVRLARWNGSEWVSEPVGPANSTTVSLAFDGAGRPTLAYKGDRDVLCLARPVGTGWECEDLDSGSKVVDGPSLAYDTGGQPAIAYRVKNKKETDLKIARFDPASGWSYQVVEATVGARYISLAFDDLDVPAIAYSDDADDDGYLDTLKYARWNASVADWDREVVRTGTRGFGVYVSLAFDPNGVATISQSASGANYAVQFLQRTGSAPDFWPDTETVASGQAMDPTHVLDSNGEAYVSYTWVSNSSDEADEVRVARRDGPNSFVTEFVALGTPIVSGRAPVAVGGPGNLPAVAYKVRLPDVLLYASQPEPVPCSTEADCADDDLCTTEQCIDETCEYTAKICDDLDPCTLDGCDPDLGCQHPPDDCDDGESCTIDECDPNTGCSNTWPACGLDDGCCGPDCQSDPDCACAPLGDPCKNHGDCCSRWCSAVKGRKICTL